MSEIIKILLPTLPTDNSETFFKGHISSDQNCTTIFITTFTHSPIDFLNENQNDNVIVGWSSCNDNVSQSLLLKQCKNYFILKKTNISQIKTLVIKGNLRSIKENFITILYDYNKVRHSETINKDEDYFSTLQILIRKDVGDLCGEFNCEPTHKIPMWLTSSMFIQHFFNYIYLLRWLLSSIRYQRKVSIKQGNLLMAILVDVIFGYVVLRLLISDKKDVGVLLMGVLEKIVNLMYSLLQWLMGAPAGLKLNNAFNKMLGKYFLYHVELWWLFLDVSGEKWDIILLMYQYLGYLGFTFQAAIISDMICLATFHSYCIYVYAARLFNIQISGLTALLRLFVGRKYNPLRSGIDSCEYTNQELFVGTVAFTILLLLLPTTVMYYIVFTMFRVLSLTVQYVLAKIIYIMQTLPLYVLALWMSQSPKIAGNIFIEEAKDGSSALVLKAKLLNKSFQDLVRNFRPPVQEPNYFEWSNVVSNIFTGKQKI